MCWESWRKHRDGSGEDAVAPSISPMAITAFDCRPSGRDACVGAVIGDVEVAIMCLDADVNELAQWRAVR